MWLVRIGGISRRLKLLVITAQYKRQISSLRTFFVSGPVLLRLRPTARDLDERRRRYSNSKDNQEALTELKSVREYGRQRPEADEASPLEHSQYTASTPCQQSATCFGLASYNPRPAYTLGNIDT